MLTTMTPLTQQSDFRRCSNASESRGHTTARVPGCPQRIEHHMFAVTVRAQHSTMVDNRTPVRGINEVTLSGHISWPMMSAGDETRFVLDVYDDSGRRSSVDCIASSARLRKSLANLNPDCRVHLRGQLRRRFWRTGQGLASRLVVDVSGLRRLR